ncbi:hypothetical protein [Mucilaginibacter flavus]|uniref:hypothetical protein n=1 Tax=Mucilaginibacter flavus TaxID=931504 RepID=UPI0025B5C1D9|nr:hypothetical protein [Mucilaginibacter flavus]MDN3580006.1 hypothetical protein [Mucilaginibacter flavus]
MPLRAFALQNGQNLGRDYFALTLLAPYCKNSYAPPPHRPPSFCPFSPEAVLQTHLASRILTDSIGANTSSPYNPTQST